MRTGMKLIFGVLCFVVIIGLTIPVSLPTGAALAQNESYIVKTGAQTDSTRYNSQRKLVVTSDGHLHVVYHRKDGGGIFQIYHAESSDRGKTWSEEEVTNEINDQVLPSLAVDSQNNLHLVWQSGALPTGANVQVYYKKKAATWGAKEFLADYAAYPSIAIDSNDNIHVVYGGYSDLGSYNSYGNGIRWREKTSSGWQAEERISSISAWVRVPAVAIDGNNNIHVVWDNCPRYAYYDLHYIEKTALGWGQEVQINPEMDNTGGVIPSIAVDSNNYVHIVWWYPTPDGHYSIRHRVYTNSWQSVEDIEGPTTYPLSFPSVSIDSKNQIYVVWSGQSSDSPTINQIRYKIYTTSWSTAQNLTSSASNDQLYPNLMWANFPVVNGIKTNVPQDGYAFVWMDGTTIRYWPMTPVSSNQPPDLPTGLLQLKSDASTIIPVGGTAMESTVVLHGTVSDPDNYQVKLQVELRRLDEYGGAFLGRFTEESDLAIGGGDVSVSVYGLVNGDYHWQARTVDQLGFTSNWFSFGNNPESAADFTVRIDHAPVASFIYSPKAPITGEEIIFDGSMSYDPDGGSIVSYSWTFGDGEAASGEKVSHTYSTMDDYIVNLTVIDDESTEKQYQQEVVVFGAELSQSIDKFVNRSFAVLDYDILQNAKATSKSADDLTQDAIWTGKETMMKLAFNALIACLDYEGITNVKKVSALSISEYADSAQELQDWPALVNVLDQLDADGGWITALILKDTILVPGMQAVSADVMKRFTDNNYSYYVTLVDSLSALINHREDMISSLKNDVLSKTQDLTQEQIDKYLQDLQGRKFANIMIGTHYARQSRLPVTAASIQQQLWNAYDICTTLGLTAVDILVMGWNPPAAVFLSIKVCKPLVVTGEAILRMNEDMQIAQWGVSATTEGYSQTDIVARNTFEGLANIKEKESPQIPQGAILDVKNYASGVREIFGHKSYLFCNNAWSELIAQNEGDNSFDALLQVQYSEPFRIAGFLFDLPVARAETKLINGNSADTLTIWFKKDGKGSIPMDQDVLFNLIADNGDGYYGLDIKSSHFGTIKTATNEFVPAEELEQSEVVTYPLRGEIDSIGNLGNYTLHLYVENPFDFPVSADLVQALTPGVDVVSTDGGIVDGDRVTWRLELESNESKEINLIVRSTAAPGTAIGIPAAILKIWDQVNAQSVDFPSDQQTLAVGQPMADAGGPYYVGTEGSAISFNGSNSRDSDKGIASYEWDFGDGSAGSGSSPTNAYGDNGLYTATLTVTDDDGLTAIDTTEVTVSNVAPTVDAGNNQNVEVFNLVSCKGNFTDPGWLDTHTAEWAWGDGSTSDGAVTESNGSGDVTGSHSYNCPGVYTITLSVTDDDGGIGTATATVTVTPQPLKAFVIKNLAIQWAPHKPRWQGSDSFSIFGRLQLPQGYTWASLQNQATVTITIAGKSGNDTVVLKGKLYGKPQSTLWSYRESEQPPGYGMNINNMIIWWTPQGANWNGWAGFYIGGILQLPEPIGVNTAPPNVTVTLEIPLTTASGCGSIKATQTVKCSVSKPFNLWFYNAWPNLPSFPYEPTGRE